MSRSTPNITVVGSANVDYLTNVASFPEPGATILAESFTVAQGGKGANQARAAARLGADVRFVGAVGDDAAGTSVRESLNAYGVDTSHLRVVHASTGSAFITVDRVGENTIVVAQGANALVDLADKNVLNADVVVTQLEIPLDCVRLVVERSSAAVLNVAPSRDVPRDVLDRCAVVVANEVEFAGLPGALSGLVIVTRGSRGAVALRGGREVAAVVSPEVNVVDTVGAGDVFVAAVAVALARGFADEEMLRFAVTAATLSTQGVGADGFLPTESDVAKCLAQESL